ncbi:hypothetical protein [Bradyrhizobium sp. RT3a]|uniref:hypothetical protein n=1 Tax=unclassified Bradyrhizobium TaxID=2631580 RepID=UPI003398551C
MPRQQAVIRVFLSSPSDLEVHRSAIADQLRRLSRVFLQRKVAIEVLTGDCAEPGMGRPQGQVNASLSVADCDIFIGMIWLRFGTPTGGQHSSGGHLYLSGTEEEFRLAHDAWRDTGRPKILFYFCNRVPEKLADIHPEQFARVTAFKESFGAAGANPGLVRNYVIPEELDTLVVSDVLSQVESMSSELAHARRGIDVSQFGLLDFFVPFKSAERELRKRASIDSSDESLAIVAHSGFSFLGRIGARYKPQVVQFLERGGLVRVALISPWSETGLALSISGVDQASLVNYRAQTRDVLCAAIEQSRWYLVKYRDAIDGYLDLAARFKGQVDLRVTASYMPATVLVTDVDAYIEPYLLADLPKRIDLMLASFEARFASTSYMYENLRDYTEYIFSAGVEFAEFAANEERTKEQFLRSFSLHERM